ncbi:MAG TPA: hypothetical protein DEB39_16385 [Planctomycetaceae bacterium]|nr:hypothetical protein [Planctomycetaceae bacterium]
MSFLEEALKLAELGYLVFQCVPNGKTPFTTTAPKGCNSATNDPDIVRKWWTQYPDCNIGIKCENLLVLDLDSNAELNGPRDVRDITDEVGPLPASPLARTGSGGWHLLFARPEADIVGSKRIKWHGRKTGIDVQVGNQYIVAPPSKHPNGKLYRWHTEPCPVTELPDLPDAWIERVLLHRKQDGPVSHTSPTVALSSTEPTSGLVDRCRAYVAAMPPAIQGCDGHSALLKVANVIFHGFGLSESEGWPIMLEYNSRCVPPWDLSDPKEERDFRRKMNQARDKPTNDYPFGHFREQYDYPKADISRLLESLNRPSVFAVEEADEKIPDRLIFVPGFIERIVRFCIKSAPHPNRMLAFCGALALMSFLITRKVRTKSGIRPNLYIIALAASGTGKDFIRKVNNYILEMTGQEAMIGETIASGEGLEEEILSHKKKFYQTDEIQTLFAEIANGKESRYNNIVAFLLKVYTSADSTIVKRTKVGDSKKNSGPTVCNQPSLILFGTTIPIIFFDALTPTLMLTGLGSRCLFIEGDQRQPYNIDAADYQSLPKELIETARWWAEYLPPDPETGKVGNLSHENPSPHVVPMTDEAVGILNALGEHADLSYSQTQDPIEQVLWTRVHEIANKLALVYACSADHENPVIDGPAARWASEFTDWVVRQMMKLVKHNVADSPFAKLVLRAENLIRKRGGKMTRTELSRSLHIRPRELDEIVHKMLEEEIIELAFSDATGGRPKTVYRMVCKSNT